MNAPLRGIENIERISKHKKNKRVAIRQGSLPFRGGVGRGFERASSWYINIVKLND